MSHFGPSLLPMKTNVRLGIVLLLAASPAFGNPVKMTYSEANALFGSLSKIQSGLTPENVGLAAQDLWVLEGPAKAFGKAQIAASQAAQRASTAKDVQAAQEKAQADWTAFTETEITLDLQSMNLPLTPDEIKESKITPDIYAPILHFLSPAKK